MDLKKVEAILSWGKPMNVTEIQCFLSLASYYKRFIKGFTIIATSLTLLTRKEMKFKWSKKREEGFHKLKMRLTTTLVLTLPLKKELECVSMQHRRVIAYTSR
jgi:hypothetical protein